MTPTINAEVKHSDVARLTVAQRKEANERRKIMKPLMEKKRRARISESLNKLKSLIIPLTGKDKSRCSKLEKADILEMTVRFLQERFYAPVTSPSARYSEGYKACLQRVSTLLSKTDLLDEDTRQKVTDYVQQSMSASLDRPCQNCSAHKSRQLLQQKIQRSPITEPLKPAPTPSDKNLQFHRTYSAQCTNSNMWRPW